jgi:FkbM family methyltransferase
MINYLDIINKNNPTIVQIGAHDGILGEEYGLQSLLETLDNFKLILIEPIEEFFNKLPEVYRKYGDKVIYKNYAITEICGQYEMKLDYGMSKIVTTGGDISVQGKTWETLVEEENIKKIDLLILDCEGYEFNILKQIDYIKTPIKVIRFEDYWITNKNECHDFLKKLNYKIDYCSHDDVYNKIAFNERD